MSKEIEAEADTSVEQPAEEVTSTTSNERLRRPWFRRKGVHIGALVLLLAAAGGVAWMQFGPKRVPAAHKQTVAMVSPSPTAEPAPTPMQIGGVLSAADRAAQLERFTHPKTGETWLSARKPLPDQNYYREKPDGDLHYFEVGKRGDATIIMSSWKVMGEAIDLFEKAPSGKVTYIGHPDANAEYVQSQDDYEKTSLAEAVAVDLTIHYDSLSIPQELVLDNGYVLQLSYRNLNLGESIDAAADKVSGIDYSTVKTMGLSSLSLGLSRNAATQLTSIMYYIVTPLQTRVYVAYNPTEFQLKEYTWSSGTKTYTDESALIAITRGCGTIAAAATRSEVLADADVRQVAVSATGNKLYEIKDLSNTLFVKSYEEFKESVKTNTDSDELKKLTAEGYQAEHGLLFFKDKFGQWLVYNRSSLRLDGGCAKPVVYLYPETVTPVSVKVGADVTVSEPHYNPASGWNTWASPTGTVWVDGKAYDSLFWEGQGWGSYPAITAGTVVRRADAPGVMRRQLAEQGLRGREITDFMEYWEPKLPNNPYIRLTWFNTAQMDELAPLAVNPKPDTSIRVFLDFDGLDEPMNLPAQRLQAPERHGFTLVEWGGLANFPLK